ncbi:tRNA (N(6)-L-threonylcarbamoyladenosine(37)-C(2))-methylthiotransferase MtaB [Roseiconus lacunae]|uniref:tRNA (N(6)-L-threonylcarbamoyladenosine(37)-C(2))-methylthiotransferase MtaB n=1 Tax=Roseiconus lacunae TaxID=2605694 RepID=A0ABT7PRH4_9BACT|nr:tRNA (N(6)-L-threonylcarbamoyladenosine(37)-C(2))-methylthiotransferase MtaB [Roseiconus lacunae]MCD0463197.1 tRNA (N(6)-L-threonylcarbamoyladenosine(37)-C(2))-methylthiotransferase MtaB [Roseiconus lacunae]MDM4018706.1 tRNA (N(6)-L-threonylcarbamoyladenosine(37)-C(2))-methylthiotransferase MtaB [Roseiconus lacunae]WRQ48599.1 tRNA (N(6)-L-threonylcarbamoyladenosine(37)-C(2))-methylthiotransferase MtaB [Stieleria sp. HD01]
MTAKLRVTTLGCKVNQYETELVRQGLQKVGFSDCDEGDQADVCIVNTCTVTNQGDAKSRQVIRRMSRDNPNARIVVMGCYATRAPDEVAALPGVVDVVTDKRELPDLMTRFGVVDVPTGLDGFSGRHRAYVKVQDGCLLRCSYCIIPHVRPALTSRPLDHIVDEVRRLTEAGHREVVLTGIHLGHYGVDWNRNKPREDWTRLADLVQQLCELPGDFRIRLSSIEATEVTRSLIAVMNEYADRVVPHLHLCLQAGSDSVLRRMRRRWGTKMFLDRCRLLRESLVKPAITTDIIAGFPGETDEEFEQTIQTCRNAGFSKIHAFPFSARRGTPAAEMPNQVHGDVKQDRIRRLGELEAELRREYYGSLVGEPVQLLVESTKRMVSLQSSPNQTVVRGTTCRYAAAEFVTDAIGTEPGQLIHANVLRAEDDRLHVRPIC